MSTGGMSPPVAVRWSANREAVELLDQTRLPEAELYLTITSTEAMVEAIRMLRVRGAPAIGVAAALGAAVDAAQHMSLPTDAFRSRLRESLRLLECARPTAVNLSWAMRRLRLLVEGLGPETPPGVVACKLHGEADAILAEDRAMCERIGAHGLALLPDPCTVLTHCNAGALATAGVGTALAPLHQAHAQGRSVRVFATETRPLLQGSRITAWELGRAGIPVTLLTDSAAAALMRAERIDAVLVGADRIAANGDVANKVGTYGLAVLARQHGIPFYVLAPRSTLDAAAASGADIPIEFRDPDEVRCGFGRLTAPAAVAVFAPAFDVTPAALIDAIITDEGVYRAPYVFE